MGDSENISEMVEEKLDLVRRYLQQALNGLEAKENRLIEVQESVINSSEKLILVQQSMQELGVVKSEVEEEEKVSHFLFLGNGFKELEIKIKKLGLVERDVMISLEKLGEKKKLIKGLFEIVKNLGYDGFVEMCLKECQAEESLRELKVIENQEVESSENGVDDGKGEETLEKLENEIERRQRVLTLKKEELVDKENELDGREKILGLRLKGLVAKEKRIEVSKKILGVRQEDTVFEDNELQMREKILGVRLEEHVFKGNELEAGEKNLSLWTELDLKVGEHESIRKLKEQFSNEPDSTNTISSGEELRQKSTKREGAEMNISCKSLKRCRHVEQSFKSGDDNEVEKTVANDLNEVGVAHSGHSDSGRDPNIWGSANPGLDSALIHSDLIADHKEADPKFARLSSGSGTDSTAINTFGLHENANPIKLEAISGSGNDDEQIFGHDVAKAYLGSRYISYSHPTDYPKLLFNDFDEDKLKNLAAGQTWASYYENDDLPRLYFRVQKVLNKPRHSGLAKLRIVWLQPLPNYVAWKKVWNELKNVNLPVRWKEWIDAGLPVGCGVFKCGKEQTLSFSLARLSGQVCCKNKNSPYVVHPSTGEIWALYNNWDIVRWISNRENNRHCTYDMVEILGRNSNGFRVVCLDKVGGFVSLFQRRSQSGKDSFLIEDQELFRFSHKVPSFKMTSNKRQGVPEGSFELDPKDLPAGFC